MALTNTDVDTAIPVAGTPSRTLTNAAMKQLITDVSGKADYFAPAAETASFVLTSAHANRDVTATSASAVGITFNTGHGMAVGDSGRIYQGGAGRLSLASGTATVTLLGDVVAAQTTTLSPVIDWVYLGGNVVQVINGIRRELLYKIGAGSGAVTGTTSETALATIPVVGGSLGPNGRLFLRTVIEKTGTAGTELVRVRLGTISGTQIRADTYGTTIIAATHDLWIANRNDQAIQYFPRNNSATPMITDTVALSSSTQDTATDWNIIVSAQPGNVADSISLIRWELSYMYGA